MAKLFLSLEESATRRAPSWLTVMVTRQQRMNTRYRWLVASSCVRIRRCSAKISSAPARGACSTSNMW